MIAKEDVLSIFEALYDQLVVSFEASKLSVDDYEVIVENFKCVYKEFSDKKKLDGITREELQDGELTSHLRTEFQVEGRQHIRAGAVRCARLTSRFRKILPIHRAEAGVRRALFHLCEEGRPGINQCDFGS